MIPEMRDVMETPGREEERPRVAKVKEGLVLAVMIGGLGVAPAIGGDEHNNKHGNKHKKGHYEQSGHNHYVQGRQVYVRERVYIPPPIVYAPPPQPGISIFFPPIFIHP